MYRNLEPFPMLVYSLIGEQRVELKGYYTQNTNLKKYIYIINVYNKLQRWVIKQNVWRLKWE